MRHHIWYVDMLRALQIAGEAQLVARNLAEDGDGRDSELFGNINVNFAYIDELFDELKDEFAEECCNGGEQSADVCTCEPHTLKRSLIFSHGYKKGQKVYARELHRQKSYQDIKRYVGKITSIKRDPTGETIFRVRFPEDMEGVIRVLSWRDIEPFIKDFTRA